MTSPSSSTPTTESSLDRAASLYLRLLRRCLCRFIAPDYRYDPLLDSMQPFPFDEELRENGLDWPVEAETMVGMKRLASLQDCCISAVRDGIPGDFVETGVWRGGCGILMRAVLEALQDDSRDVWLFDSFCGLPRPNPSYPADAGDMLWSRDYLRVSLDVVKQNFQRYELLDERARFVPGWFRDTMPAAEVRKIAVLRLDGDMYESTWQVLSNLYPKLSPGGFVIVDDYGAIQACRQAVDEFRDQQQIASPISSIDWTGIFWRK